MAWMCVVTFLHKFQNRVALLGFYLISTTPFIVSRPTDSTKFAKFFDGKFLRKNLNYRVFFSDKGTN